MTKKIELPTVDKPVRLTKSQNEKLIRATRSARNSNERPRADRVTQLPATLQPGEPASRLEQLEFQRGCLFTAYRLVMQPGDSRNGSVADTRAGRKLLRDVIEPITKKIEAAQIEAREALEAREAGEPI